MKIFVKSTISGLIPASRTEFDKLQSAKLKIGEFYKVEITKQRNPKHHKKFFVLLNLCFNNQDIFNNQDQMRKWITMKAGFVEKVITPTGFYYDAQSISFSKMDQTEFDDYYNKCINVCLNWIGFDREDLMEEINSF